MTAATVFRLKHVIKNRKLEGSHFRLHVPSIEIKQKESVALVGPSGSGKSTLLDMMAMILRPDEATTFKFYPRRDKVADIALTWKRGNQNRLSDLRKRHLGYVIQTGGLLPYLTVRENIDLPRRLLKLPHDDTVTALASELGIKRQLDKLPGLLSTGERQRVAFARALAHGPSTIIADEPTSSLDPITSRRIMATVMDIIQGLGITLIIASHDWAHVYKLDFRSLYQESRERNNGSVIESIFRD